ncbi:hypothetical protein, partial [Paracoccus haematequi]|uniref:hypothetical protein n=1 Tax=Paracoccus haematequi TaxID=2491866 RepID=UPI0019D26D1A
MILWPWLSWIGPALILSPCAFLARSRLLRVRRIGLAFDPCRLSTLRPPPGSLLVLPVALLAIWRALLPVLALGLARLPCGRLAAAVPCLRS